MTKVKNCNQQSCCPQNANIKLWGHPQNSKIEFLGPPQNRGMNIRDSCPQNDKIKSILFLGTSLKLYY